MPTLVRADGEAIVIAMLAEHLTELPPYTCPDSGASFPAVASQTPTSFGTTCKARPFVTVRQIGTRVRPFCLQGGTSPIERLSLQVDVYGSGVAGVDRDTHLIDPCTDRPFTSPKAETQHLAQLVAACFENACGFSANTGSISHSQVESKIWMPEPKGDRSRYTLTVLVTIASAGKKVAGLNEKVSQ